MRSVECGVCHAEERSDEASPKERGGIRREIPRFARNDIFTEVFTDYLKTLKKRKRLREAPQKAPESTIGAARPTVRTAGQSKELNGR